MLAGAKSPVVEMFAFGDRAIGKCRTVGSLSICDLWNRGCDNKVAIKGDGHGTAEDVSMAKC